MGGGGGNSEYDEDEAIDGYGEGNREEVTNGELNAFGAKCNACGDFGHYVREGIGNCKVDKGKVKMARAKRRQAHRQPP